MAQRYYNTEKAAELLGVAPADVTRLRERRELNGYRDGADWKFKAEDVEALIAKRSAGGGDDAEPSGDIVLSELTLGQSDSDSSGTVLGMDERSGDSDIRLSDDEGILAPEASSGSFNGLDLALEGSGLSLNDKGPAAGAHSDHALDDDLALGASGSGSDITVGGDSGISLIDPADSGLSLEDPLEFAADASSDETLQLGEADIVLEEPETLEKGGSGDFLLQPPSDEVSEGEDSDSGSQVIALDLEAEGDEGATMISGSAPSAPAALPDDFATADMGPMVPAVPLDAEPIFGAAPEAAAMSLPTSGIEPGPTVVVAPTEVPYSTLNIVSLSLCCLLLAFCGMFMYDVIRNMWSWNSEFSVNSSMMDFLLGLFES